MIIALTCVCICSSLYGFHRLCLHSLLAHVRGHYSLVLMSLSISLTIDSHLSLPTICKSITMVCLKLPPDLLWLPLSSLIGHLVVCTYECICSLLLVWTHGFFLSPLSTCFSATISLYIHSHCHYACTYAHIRMIIMHVQSFLCCLVIFHAWIFMFHRMLLYLPLLLLYIYIHVTALCSIPEPMCVRTHMSTLPVLSWPSHHDSILWLNRFVLSVKCLEKDL